MRGGMAVREGEMALLYALSSCMHVFVALVLMTVDLIKVHASGLQTVCFTILIMSFAFFMHIVYSIYTF